MSPELVTLVVGLCAMLGAAVTVLASLRDEPIEEVRQTMATYVDPDDLPMGALDTPQFIERADRELRQPLR